MNENSKMVDKIYYVKYYIRMMNVNHQMIILMLETAIIMDKLTTSDPKIRNKFRLDWIHQKEEQKEEEAGKKQ